MESPRLVRALASGKETRYAATERAFLQHTGSTCSDVTDRIFMFELDEALRELVLAFE